MLHQLKKSFLNYLLDDGGWVTAAIAVGSALTSAYGQYKAGKDQAEAARQQARIGLMRAEEILSRNEINNGLLKEAALVQQGTQITQTFGSGKTLASTRNLVADTMTKANKQIELNTRQAEWEARMARLGAESQLASAENIEQASAINAIGTAGFGAARAYANSPGTTPTTANPYAPPVDGVGPIYTGQ